MIKQIPQEKWIILHEQNNNKQVLDYIVKKRYIYVFTNLKIGFLKRFNNSILDQTSFIDHLALLAINNIYLVEESDKNFWPIYAEIKKVWKKIPCNILLLDILAMLSKSI